MPCLDKNVYLGGGGFFCENNGHVAFVCIYTWCLFVCRVMEKRIKGGVVSRIFYSSFLMPPAQAKYWLLTIPENDFKPKDFEELPEGITYIRGQLECGEGTGYRHWQLIVYYAKKCRLAKVKSNFGSQCHAEPSRSEAARQYVWKDETSVAGTRFEFGTLAMRRNDSTDWESARNDAREGRLDRIPADVYIRYYGNLQRIRMEHMRAVGLPKRVRVYWGVSSSGKSYRAWSEAGLEAYPKDPRTKFWDGYRGHEKVVIDEFRGSIDISHILRWLDRYPTFVEVKGASVPLMCNEIWITSNLHPREWYPDLDPATREALLRRLEITEFAFKYTPKDDETLNEEELANLLIN